MAHCLKQNGLNVELWNIDKCMPPLSSAEREGPFGVFVPDFLNQTGFEKGAVFGPFSSHKANVKHAFSNKISMSERQKAWLCGDIFFPVPSGFSVLNSDGPVEFQGPLRDFLLKKRQDFRLCHSILSGSGETGKNNLQKQGLTKDLWLYHFVEEVSSSHISPLFAPLMKRKNQSPFYFPPAGTKKKDNMNLPLLGGEYILRESSQRHFDHLNRVLEQEGIKCLSFSSDPAELNSALSSLMGKGLVSPWRASSSDNKKGVSDSSFQKTFLIWTLGGLETARHFPKYMPFLFPRWEEPVHIWQRFSLSWDHFQKTVPAILFIAPDKGFWSGKTSKNTDFLVLKKNPSSCFVDLWVLCSYSVRSDSVALSSALSSALNRLHALFPGLDLKGVLPEEEGRQNYFVLYKNKYREKKSRVFSKNFLKTKKGFSVLHLNPESVGKGDSYSLMLGAQSLAQQLSLE